MITVVVALCAQTEIFLFWSVNMTCGFGLNRDDRNIAYRLGDQLVYNTESIII